MVEAAAAILIVGGVLGIAETIIAGADRIGGSDGLPTDVVVGFVLNGISIAAGWLLRTGRSWVICLNVAAIYAFLYLSSFPNPLGIVLGAAKPLRRRGPRLPASLVRRDGCLAGLTPDRDAPRPLAARSATWLEGRSGRRGRPTSRLQCPTRRGSPRMA